VAAADWNGKPQPTSALGPPAFVELARKPSLLAYDQVVATQGPAYGTSLANAFAAGTAASLISSGLSREQLSTLFRERQGKVLVVPAKK